MPDFQNPAHRLHSFLVKAKSCQPNRPTLVAWAEALDVHPDSSAELLHGLSQLQHLYRDTVKSLEDTIPKENREIFLRFMPKIQNVLHPNRFHNNWGDTAAKLTADLMLSLEHCAVELGKYHQEYAIEDDKISSLQSDIQSLTDDVLKSELDSDLKAFIVRHLEEIRQALIYYRLRGIELLRRAFEATTAGLIIHWDIIESANQAPEVNRFAAVYRRVREMVTFALDIKRLSTEAIKMLPAAEKLTTAAEKLFKWID